MTRENLRYNRRLHPAPYLGTLRLPNCRHLNRMHVGQPLLQNREVFRTEINNSRLHIDVIFPRL